MKAVTMMAALLALAGCGGPARPLGVDGAWVRLPANPGAPAAGYATVHGGARNDTLTGVDTDEALRAEMHETMAMPAGTMPGAGSGASGAGAMTTMTPLRQVAVPANGEVAFRPGGRHLMLFDVNRGIRPGGTMVLFFVFASGERVAARAKVIAAGDPVPI